MAVRTSRVTSVPGLAAIAGLVLFGVMAWRSVTVDRAEPEDVVPE